ncbi:ricin-type beta-trefoil lectin domain protein [Streptomyces sp. NPDC058746]|uniref:RICIN domain-containing protein n=1 Tax=Streptomyces sp. NPDC058746 TaxID=3346622 RepID=UPI0036C1365D
MSFSKRSAGRMLATAVALPALVMTMVQPAAAADNEVTWTNRATEGCLEHVYNDKGGFEVRSNITSFACSMTGKKWTESQSNLQNADGAYSMSPPSAPNWCMASWYADANGVGSVYMEPCDSPRNYYQQWYEVKDGDRWRLVNRQTGLCLDSNKDDGLGNGYGAVYTMKCNGGNYQAWD